MSVQNGTEGSYTWQNDSEEAHKIKVVVTDSENKTATVEKDYDLEQDADVTPTPVVTVPPTETLIPVLTGEPTGTPTEDPTSDLAVKNSTLAVWQGSIRLVILM